MMKRKKRCQSCGKSLKKDLSKAGTHPDGSKSDSYCHLCYEEGAFIQPDITVSDMKKYRLEQLRERKIPAFLARLIASHLPKLDRWNNR